MSKLTVDEYVLVKIIDGGDKLEIVADGYDDLEDAQFSMDNYPEKGADIRIIAFMG